MPKVVEEDFPRGGATKKNQGGTHVSIEHPEENELFSAPANKPSKVTEKKSKGKDSGPSTYYKGPSWQVEVLHRKTLTSDILVLGCISRIDDYELHVSLPGGLHGYVPITSISRPYTSLLQRLADGDVSDEVTEEIGSLHEMFYVGQPISCRVEATGDKGDKKGSKLCVDPQVVNTGLHSAALHAGMIIPASVTSREDHGYVIDLGIKGVNAFIRKKDGEAYSSYFSLGSAMKVGSVLHCKILTSTKGQAETTRTVALTVNPAEVYKSAIEDDVKIPFHMLVPGMLIHTEVTKKTEYGFMTRVLAYSGCIPKEHARLDSQKLKAGDKMIARILHVNHANKAVSVSILPHLVRPEPEPAASFAGLPVGHVIEDAIVICAIKDEMVILNISAPVVAVARKAHLYEEKGHNCMERFKKGSSHRCRVLHYNYMENVVMVTLNENIIEQEVLGYSDLKPGMFVQGTVKKLIEGKGMVVKITHKVQGFVPYIHLADTLLTHPEARYSEGNTVQCQVLSVDVERGKLRLTCKKSLLSSKSPCVTSYHQVRNFMMLEGHILSIQDKGIVVAFYNNVKGFVPRSEWSTENIEYPDQVFFPGQVVKCQAISVEPQKAKLTLTFKMQTARPFGAVRKDHRNPASKTKQQQAFGGGKEEFHDIRLWLIMDGEITRKNKNGLMLSLSPLKVEGYLPTPHLSDNVSHANQLMDLYNEGDTLKDLVVIGFSTSVILTNKQSYRDAALQEKLPSDFNQLEEGMLMPGHIKGFKPHGVFVGIFGGIDGLVPRKYLADKALSDPEKFFQKGQTVMVRVVEVNRESEKLLLSLRMSHCHVHGPDVGVNILAQYLKEERLIQSHLKHKKGKVQKLCGLSMSDLVTLCIEEVTDAGAVGVTDDDVRAVATYQHMTGVSCKVGDRIEGVILYIDRENACLEVSLNKDLVTRIKKFHDTKFSQAFIGQCIKSEVQIVKEDFVLVSLKGHASGRFAYLPAKKDFNDVMEKYQYSIGQVNPVVIKRHLGDVILASLQLNEIMDTNTMRKTNTGNTSSLTKRKIITGGTSNLTERKTNPGSTSSLDMLDNNIKADGTFELGESGTAIVKIVKKTSASVEYKGTTLTIQASQMCDVVKERENPFKRLRCGADITVRVIGFSESKRRGFHKEKVRMPVLCAKESILSLPSDELGENLLYPSYQPGDKVTAFFLSCDKSCLLMEVTPCMKGRVSLVDCHPQLKVQKKPRSYFKEGAGFPATVVKQVSEILVDLTLLDASKGLVEVGSVISAKVISWSEKYGLEVALPGGNKGHAALTDLADDYDEVSVMSFKPGDTVKCAVVEFVEGSKKTVVSLRRSRVIPATHPDSVIDPEIASLEQLTAGSVLRGFVVNCDHSSVFLRLSRDLVGRALLTNACECTLEEPEEVFTIGRVLSAAVMNVQREKGKIDMSFLEKDTGVKFEIPGELHKSKKSKKLKRSHIQKEDSFGEESSPKKPKLTQIRGKSNDSGVDSDFDDELEVNTSISTSSAPRLNIASRFSWDCTFQLPETSATHSGSEDSSDEESLKPKPKAKMSKAERREKQKAESAKIFQTEQQLQLGQFIGETAEDFDRLVLQSPDSSLVWLRYMAYHLETTEIEKTRVIAERALKTISFREEQEKMNIWVAYLNLENMYGTHESLTKVFERALQQNEPVKIYQQLINIYIKSGKIEAADQLHSTLIRKYSQNKDVWANYGLFFFKNEKMQNARKLLQRALKSLNQKDHVEIIAKFAQMEFKHGEPERGKTMFENLLSSYSKRTDIWSVYIDMLTKLNEHEAVRQLFERVINMKLGAKKIKVFFKKYLSFEEKYGTDETIKHVKQKAVEYVESKMDTS